MVVWRACVDDATDVIHFMYICDICSLFSSIAVLTVHSHKLYE